MHYRYRETIYHIAVVQMAGVGEMGVSVDGIAQHDKTVPLVDDHKEHRVQVRIRNPSRLVGAPGGGEAQGKIVSLTPLS